MSKRAEEAALKALPNYPRETYVDEDEYIEIESERSMQRAFYRKGYEQSEKDLALTADEIRSIFNRVRIKQSMYNATEGCYQEVADWFNSQREKK
jgi:hypothetical protein